MKTNKFVSLFVGFAILLLFSNTGLAVVTGEEALFVSSTQPDVLVLLDLSGSMQWNPAGDDLTYGSTTACTADTTNCSGTGCSGGFCGSSKAPTIYYAHDASCTADTTNCVGTGCSLGFCNSAHNASSYYASSAACTSDMRNCQAANINCGRTDGFCTNPLPAGTTYYAHDSTCTANRDHCDDRVEAWKNDCKNGFCRVPHHSKWNIKTCEHACTTTGCSTACTTGSCANQCTSGGCQQSCSRLNIAKRSVFNILDDNNDSTISNDDELSLGVRLGYMRFYNCQDDSAEANDTYNYSSGCNTLIKDIGTSYSAINTSVQAAGANGGTPLAAALKEARLYLNDHKAADASKSCRSKFIILITDGSDTFACDANGSECDSHRYKSRREAVAAAKALSDAGYKVFVIGFGTSMPPYLRNTLNWMAYYGGTDNSREANSITAAYTIPTATDCTAASPANSAACCNLNSSGCYPSGVTGCTDDGSTSTAACYDSSHPYPTTGGSSTSSFRASSNDPGYLDISGYAYLAGNADELVAAVKASINIIRQATYSFTQASIQTSRTADENYIYEGSFDPVNGDPFWIGHLKKYQINDDGSVGAMLLDGGTVLRDTTYSTRNILTCLGCAESYTTPITPTVFSNSIDRSYFGALTDAARDDIVSYIKGDPSKNPDNWKLGDVFRSTPITFGTPSAFYEDFRDTSSSSLTCTEGTRCDVETTNKTVNAFGAYRCDNCRASANGHRIIVTGANDGQFHAFKTSDMTEVWSFVPPNLLSKLTNIVHTSEPTNLVHQYFIDGPVSGSDVWVGSGDGRSKSSSNWHTILVFGEARGSTDRLWSSSASCSPSIASGADISTVFSSTYSGTFPNYCGYFALDVTDSLNPKYWWHLNGFNGTTQAPYMGEAWSKMIMGRVLTKTSGGTETEKWVGFVGAGYNANTYKTNGDMRGKGFYIVDMSNGSILWSYTLYNNSVMKYSLPAPPSTVDTDNDGFVDTVYIGDLGGNMWRFKFCTKSMIDATGGCTISDWSAGLFFDSSTGSIRPIFTGATAAKDSSGNLWIYWGTGDKVDPTASNAQEHFYAVRDNRTSTYRLNDIDTLSNSTQVFDPATSPKPGYRIQLNGSGEKILAEPTVFGGVVYFTSYSPQSGGNDPCNQSGTAYLNGVNFTTGAGVFGNGARQMSIGNTIPSGAVVSMGPTGTASIYVTCGSTAEINFPPPGMNSRSNMIYWRDTRIQ